MSTSKDEALKGHAEAWRGFKPGLWQRDVNVRWFLQQNYTPYDGDEKFLAPATERTKRIWKKLEAMFVEERKKGVLDVSPIPSSITAHAPGYIDKEHEVIVGLQTDAPLKRAIMPNGGLRMVINSLKAYNFEADPKVVEAFTKYRKTHNDGVFDAYTADIRACRSSHVLTGLPDAYGREIAKIEPLHRFTRCRGRPGNIKAVALCHRLQFIQCADLLAQFLAVANDFLRGHREIESGFFSFLLLDEALHAVQWDPAVISDNPTPAIGIGQPGENMRTAAGTDVWCIRVEYAVVVGLTIFGEGFLNRRVWFVTVSLE